MQSKDRKTLILETIDTMIARIKKSRRNRELLGRVTLMKARVEKSGSIETETQQFVDSILKELDDLIHCEGLKIQREKYRQVVLWRSGYFLLTLFNFCIGTFTSFQSRLLPSRPVTFFAWLMIGLLGSTLSLIIYVSYHRTLEKMMDLLHEIPAITSNRKKELYTKLAIIILISMCSTVVVTSLYILILTFYPRVFPPLVTLVTQAFHLDIGSLLGTIFIIIGNVGALITLYEFLEKRLQKRRSKQSP